MRVNTLIFISLQFMFLKIHGQVWQAPQALSSHKINQAYFSMAFRYPAATDSKKNSGKILVCFTVDNQGNTKDFRIEKSSDESLNAEAIRLAQKILWKPAIHNGSSVESQACIDVPFNRKHAHKRMSAEGMPEGLTKLSCDTSNKIYTFATVEHLPQPLLPQNYRNLSHYIAMNLKYPEAALLGGIEGVVQVGLVVEEDGTCSNIHIISHVGGGCDQEAIRILQSVRWLPAIKDSVYVRSRSQIDVSFHLREQRQQQIPNRQSGGL